MARIATEIMMAAEMGQPSGLSSLRQRTIPYFGVKEAVFPFNMFPEVDPLLGPEMRSTGEVLGLADSFGLACFKAQEATRSALPLSGTVLISVNDRDKAAVLEVAREYDRLGFRILSTDGSHKLLLANARGIGVFLDSDTSGQTIRSLQEYMEYRLSSEQEFLYHLSFKQEHCGVAGFENIQAVSFRRYSIFTSTYSFNL